MNWPQMIDENREASKTYVVEQSLTRYYWINRNHPCKRLKRKRIRRKDCSIFKITDFFTYHEKIYYFVYTIQRNS